MAKTHFTFLDSLLQLPSFPGIFRSLYTLLYSPQFRRYDPYLFDLCKVP